MRGFKALNGKTNRNILIFSTIQHSKVRNLFYLPKEIQKLEERTEKRIAHAKKSNTSVKCTDWGYASISKSA